MKNIRLILSALAIAGTLNACTYTPPEPPEDPTNPRTPPVAGNADFSKYVAVGNSITAGFMDNALYLEGQQNAYPVILGERMKFVNNNAPFNIPAFGTAGGNGYSGTVVAGIPLGRYKFILPTCATDPAQTKKLGMTPGPTIPGEALAAFGGNKAELNNFGVTGAKSFHALVAGYGQLNPFFGRFASGTTASMLSDAVAAKGTFFTYWLGNNDILAYAISGGSGNPNPGTNPLLYGTNDITPTAVFAATLKSSIDALLSTGNNTKGAIANIPNVARLPFFQVVNAGLTAGGANAPIPFSLTAIQANALNTAYAQQGPAAARVNFREGKVNYPVIITATGLRHMDPTKDFLTLLTPQDNLLAGPISDCNQAPRGGWGISVPIPNQYVLDEAEAAIIAARVTDYNNVIQQEVASRNGRVALVNINVALAGLDATTNSIAPPAGLFSLDGVHPNPRGQALIANEFIKAINAAFGSTLPPVNTNNYRINPLPGQ